MVIIKSTSSAPRKCQYGDFELVAEPGWKLSHSFIDYESGLLVVTVSILDKSKWVNTGFGTTIPTREYKIDLKTLSVLEPDQWKLYFNYDRVEFISQDRRYKLVSQRVFEPQRNSDGYNEELYDLNSNKLISSGSSVAFRADKRETLLESLYRHEKEKAKQKNILDSKPTLQEFFLTQLNQLKKNDDILYYHDKSNVFRLNYCENNFNLARSGPLPSDARLWKSAEFELVSAYDTIDEFWKVFTADPKWFLKYHFVNSHGLLSSKVLLLAKHIVTCFNELRRTHNFTYRDYDKINNWSNLVWSAEYKETELEQWCSNCYEKVSYQPRYPKYICSTCFSKNKFHQNGHLLEFSNLGFSGGLKITYMNAEGKTIREDDTQDYCECLIDNKLFFAQEAKFGGIVIQKKE